MLSNSHDEYQFKYHQIRILPILYSIFCFFALLPISIVPSLLIPLCPRIHSYLTWNSPERQFFERREPRVVMVAGSSSRQARRHKESASISRTSSSTPTSCQSSYHILCSSSVARWCNASSSGALRLHSSLLLLSTMAEVKLDFEFLFE